LWSRQGWLVLIWRSRWSWCTACTPGICGPGRVATFEQLGKAIDDAFARWDHNHLHEFTLADGTLIIPARWWDGEEPQRSLDGAKARLGRLRPGEQFAYTFDLGDNWQHLCTVAPQRADPLETLGIIPVGPLPC
jgi:Plasmid pRiA4b ORF-3-like protein